ncbi:S66 peptidase family protein [Algibacter lectus]|nr:LD-carboxypeptidase [Algibacter lectus]MDO7136961.1 LD-carboxypeptidase [Algibacter lectus]
MYIYIMTRITFITILFCSFFFFGKTTLLAQETTLKNSTKLIQPPYLKAGDTVAIVAPSGVIKNGFKEIEAAKVLLKSWGLHTIVGEHVFSQADHFAGTDDERCADFQSALDNPTVSAIWCARGGYGTVRILDKLDYTKFKQHPKWLIGYSDITALHNQFNNEGIESIHGIMCVSLPNDLSTIEKPIATFKAAIFGKPLSYTLESSAYNRAGSVSAPLVGGNLTLLHTMLGSKTSIDTNGKILFIEEVGEYKYHIDRMLQSLKRAGYFDNCKGVIIGGISRVRKNTTPWGTSIEQLFIDALSDYNFPIAFNVPAGHEKDNRALILGRTIDLNVSKEKSTIVFK